MAAGYCRLSHSAIRSVSTATNLKVNSGENHMDWQFLSRFLVLAYLGPETIMPIASIIATIVGILLFAWRYIINFFKKIFRRGNVTVEEPAVMMNVAADQEEEQ
jgi:hypothetical protein